VRRLMTLGVAAVLALGLAACGGDDDDDSGGSATDATSGGTGAATITPVEDGVLTVQTALPAPGWWNGDDPGDLDGGFEYAMAQEIAERLGLDEVKVDNVDFGALVAGQTQDFDLALSQVTITPERNEVVDFTVPYFSSDQGVMVNEGTEVPDFETAQGLQWGVQAATTGQTFLDEQIQPTKEPKVFQDTPSMFTSLESGQVDAVMLDTAIVLAQAGVQDAEVVAQFQTGEEYGGILPKGTENLDAINSVIEEMESDGTLEDLRVEYLVPEFGGDPADVPYLEVG